MNGRAVPVRNRLVVIRFGDDREETLQWARVMAPIVGDAGGLGIVVLGPDEDLESLSDTDLARVGLMRRPETVDR